MSFPHPVKIAPSLLSADFGRLAEEIKAAEAAGGDVLHVDVMDGSFVPNITIGQMVVRAIRKAASIPLEVHLMIVQPEKYIEEFAQAGADVIFVHVETCPHLHRTLQQIKATGKKVGVSINPHTPIEMLTHILSDVSSVLIMTVNPGFGGQAFIPAMVPKIAALRDEIKRRGLAVEIAVDGGIGPATSGAVVQAGATNLIAGASIFGKPDYRAAIDAIRAGYANLSG